MPAVPPPPPAPPSLVERARHRPLLALAVVALVAWVAGLAGAVVGNRIARDDSSPARTPSTLGLVQAEPRTEPLPSMDVYAAASAIGPSVVSIDVVAGGAEGVLRGSGTGVVLTADGEIVTNAHVVEGATSVRVRLPGETEPRIATVLISDPARDLALLRIDADALRPAEFADPADIRVGDEVAAVGFALGLDGDPSVTVGIVSALHRTSADEQKALKNLIQTDAPISSGNSGGPLVNSLGQVVGIITFVAVADLGSQANDLGFAISNAELLPNIERLREEVDGGLAPIGFLGVQLAPRDDGGSGALVTDVVADSPADAAGLLVGDAVVSIDGVPITGEAGLVATIRDHAPGDEITIDLRRDGEPITVTATLAPRPPD
jgi:S1-C subfamily serine protease